MFSSLVSFLTKNTSAKKEPFLKICSDHVAEIPSLFFIGNYSFSPSQEWILLWRDADEDNISIGYRTQGHGVCLLLNTLTHSIKWRVSVERPNDGQVSNSGICCFADWQFGDNMNGIFYVLSQNGDSIIEKSFSDVNIFNCTISPSGRFAICKTAENKKSKDSNSFFIFDVFDKGKIIRVINEQKIYVGFKYIFSCDETSFTIETINGEKSLFPFFP